MKGWDWSIRAPWSNFSPQWLNLVDIKRFSLTLDSASNLPLGNEAYHVWSLWIQKSPFNHTTFWFSELFECDVFLSPHGKSWPTHTNPAGFAVISSNKESKVACNRQFWYKAYWPYQNPVWLLLKVRFDRLAHLLCERKLGHRERLKVLCHSWLW
jgi:hypothetical protein